MMGGITLFVAQASPRFAAWRAARYYRSLQQRAAVLMARMADDDLELAWLFAEMRTTADLAACSPDGRLQAANDAPPSLAALKLQHQQQGQQGPQAHQHGGHTPCA
jgi:hypothetical protein